MIMQSRNTSRQVFVPSSAVAQFVFFDDHMIHVSLTDGRVISVPLSWLPRLEDASPEEREQVRDRRGRGKHTLAEYW